MRALSVATHSVSNPAAQLILSGQSKQELTVTFDETRLDALMGLDETRLAVFVDAAGDPSAELAELAQVEYAKTLAKVMKARG